MSNAPLFPDQPLNTGPDAAGFKHVTIFGGKVYLTRRQVPQHYPISEHTLAKMASERRGPRFYKPTDKALYLPADIEAWIEAAAVLPATDATPSKAPAPLRAAKPRANTGRGRAIPTPKRDGAAAPSGRHLKSLPTTPDAWLGRNG